MVGVYEVITFRGWDISTRKRVGGGGKSGSSFRHILYPRTSSFRERRDCFLAGAVMRFSTRERLTLPRDDEGLPFFVPRERVKWTRQQNWFYHFIAVSSFIMHASLFESRAESQTRSEILLGQNFKFKRAKIKRHTAYNVNANCIKTVRPDVRRFILLNIIKFIIYNNNVQAFRSSIENWRVIRELWRCYINVVYLVYLCVMCEFLFIYCKRSREDF